MSSGGSTRPLERRGYAVAVISSVLSATLRNPGRAGLSRAAAEARRRARVARGPTATRRQPAGEISSAGMLPIAIGIGTDPSFRAPMAIVVIGGLISSTFLSLLLIPIVFAFVDDAIAWNRQHLPKPRA